MLALRGPQPARGFASARIGSDDQWSQSVSIRVCNEESEEDISALGRQRRDVAVAGRIATPRSPSNVEPDGCAVPT